MLHTPHLFYQTKACPHISFFN